MAILKKNETFQNLTNQLTGFCMMGTLVVKGLITASYDHLKEKRNFSELTWLPKAIKISLVFKYSEKKDGLQNNKFHQNKLLSLEKFLHWPVGWTTYTNIKTKWKNIWYKPLYSGKQTVENKGTRMAHP